MKGIIAGFTIFLASMYAYTPSIAQTCYGALICPVQLTFEPVQGVEPTANDQEYVYVSAGNIISSLRGTLAQGRDPDINAEGEVVYVNAIVGSDGRFRPQIFSTTRGQLTNIEDPGEGGASSPSINSLGEVVYLARDSENQTQVFSTLRGQLTFITYPLSALENPEIDDNGHVVFAAHGVNTDNIYQVNSNGTVTDLTFFQLPLAARQPTLAAETGELVYLITDSSTGVLKLFSERDGLIFEADPDPGFNFGVFPDLSPRGRLVFEGRVDSTGTPPNTNQTWLGIRACNGIDEVCTFPGFACTATSVAITISPNRIRITKGETSVTVLSAADFDATTVDSTTVTFGKTGTEASPTTVRIRDANRDAQKDLVLRFKNADTGLECGDTQAILKGETFDGHVIEGATSIVTIGCK